MKILPAVAAAIGLLAPLAGRAPAQELVACGADTVAVFHDTKSPDGRYALGWTIRPHPGKPPVDWSGYKGDNTADWMDKYPTDDEETKGDYAVVNGVLDLRDKQFVTFKSDLPYFPNKNHYSLGIAWSGEQHGSRFAVVNNDARFYTAELWLLETNASGIHVTDIAPAAYRITRPYLRKHAAKNYARLAVSFSTAFDGGNNAGSPSAAFKDGKLHLGFDAEVPKSVEDDNYTGTITIALPTGKMLGISGR